MTTMGKRTGFRQSQLRAASVLVALALLPLVLFAGCQSTASTKRSGSSSSVASSSPRSLTRSDSSDACSNRLYEICEPLLDYYTINHHHLPANLEELRAIQPDPPLNLNCPVSGQPYVYDPVGLAMPGQPWRIIVYDASPVHGGKRWAISITEPSGNDPLVTKVLMVPDAWITAHSTPP
jgi:hypothetical protein